MHRNIKHILSLVAACILTPAISYALISPAHENSTYFYTTWKGVASQTADNEFIHTKFSVVINISDNDFRIDYKSLKCGGHLVPIEVTSQRMVFRESLTYGADICSDGGKVVLRRLSPGSTGYEWLDGNNKTSARGILINHKKKAHNNCNNMGNSNSNTICV